MREDITEDRMWTIGKLTPRTLGFIIRTVGVNQENVKYRIKYKSQLQSTS